MKNSCSEKKLSRNKAILKKASLIDNLEGFTVKRNCSGKQLFRNQCFPLKFAKSLRTPILKNICKRLLLFIHIWWSCRLENHVQIEKPVLFSLTSLQLVRFYSFLFDFFIHIWFGFGETKLSKGKLYGKLRPQSWTKHLTQTLVFT